MENNIIFSNNNCNNSLYNEKKQTITIENCNDTLYFIFDNYIPSSLNLEISNSNVTILEIFKGNIPKCEYTINIPNNSSLNRLSIFVDTTSSIDINKIVNNHGFYKSMQLDLNNENVISNENINMLQENANALIFDGIYATNNSVKKYQTNIIHIAKSCKSEAKIFAINNEKAHVSIYTDAYIKAGATSTNTTQEGRIINLSNTCSGIVLPNLHIDENDVLASHSCSVGSVNKDHLYYLESRGFTEKQAKNILILGYFNPLLKNINDEQIKENISNILKARIS